MHRFSISLPEQSPVNDDGTSSTRPVDVTMQVDLHSNSMIVAHGFWSVIGKVANLLAAFLNTALVARLLTPVEFADLNAIRTLMMLLAIGLASGLAQNALRRLGCLTPAEKKSALPAQLVRLSLVQFLVAAIAVGFLSAVILRATEHQVVRTSLPPLQLVISVAGIVLIGASELISEIHRGLGKPGVANLVGGIKGAPFATLLFVGLLSIAALAGCADFLTANSLFVVATGITVAHGLRSLRRLLHSSSTSQRIVVANEAAESAVPVAGTVTAAIARDFHQPWRAAVPLSLGYMVSFAMLQGDLILAGGLSSADDYAAYIGARRCIQLISLPLVIVNTMASGIMTPLLTSGRSQLLERTLRGFCGAAAIPALGLSAAFVLAPELSLRLILGPSFAAGARTLQILVVGQLIYVLTGSCGLLLTQQGWRRTALGINLASLLGLLIAAPIFGDSHGASGLATVQTAVLAMNNLLMWLAAWRLTGLNTWCSFAWLLKLRNLKASAQQSWRFRSPGQSAHSRTGSS